MSVVAAVTWILLTQPIAVVPLQPDSQPRAGGFLSVIAAFLAIGLLAAVAKFATTKPKRRRRPPR